MTVFIDHIRQNKGLFCPNLATESIVLFFSKIYVPLGGILSPLPYGSKCIRWDLYYIIGHHLSPSSKKFPDENLKKWAVVSTYYIRFKGARYLLIIHEVQVAMGLFFCRGAR